MNGTDPNAVAKSSLLCLTFTGFLVFIYGILLAVVQGRLVGETKGQFVRSVVALPPIAVGSYVFLAALFRDYSAVLPDPGVVVVEVLFSTISTLLVWLISVFSTFGLVWFTLSRAFKTS